MISKERVKLAMAHAPADRLPINFRATDQIVQRLAHYLNTDYYGILQYFKVDFREVIPPYTGPYPGLADDGSELDIWGVGRKEVVTEEGRDVLISINPLKDAATVEEVAGYAWPRADRFDFSCVDQMVRDFQDYAVSTPGIHIEGYHGVFHILTYLFGMENAMMLLLVNPEIIEAAIDKIMAFFIEYYDRLLTQGQGKIDFVFYKDDFGGQKNLLISQDMYNTFFGPNIKKLSELAESHGANFILHSCGSISKLIPNFIESGVKVLDPIQVTAKDMDIIVIKDTFGDTLTFHGGIDVQKLMPFGTVNEVKATAKNTIDVLGAGGGYFFSPAHRFQADTPLENIFALYETVFEYGVN